MNLLNILRYLNQQEEINKIPKDLNEYFNNAWIKAGDSLSLSYCGTRAMKKRFKNEIMNSIDLIYLNIKRYIINNFQDGYYQDCNDYYLNKLNPKVIKIKERYNISMKKIIICILIIMISMYSNLILLFFSMFLIIKYFNITTYNNLRFPTLKY